MSARSLWTMTWHQAVGPNQGVVLKVPLGHQIKIGRVVVAEECRLPKVSPLGDLMRNFRDNDTPERRHLRNRNCPSDSEMF